MERRAFFHSLSGLAGGAFLPSVASAASVSSATTVPSTAATSSPAAPSSPSSLAALPDAAALRDRLCQLDPADDRYWQLIREQFLLPDDYTYLNTGGLGACPLPVIRTVKQRSDAEDTRPAAGHNMNDWWAMKEAAAPFFGPGVVKEELAFVSTATEGINIVLNGLPLESGDEIIASTHEHPALNIPLLNLKQERGLGVRFFEPDRERAAGNLERIEALITRRTKLIFISHITCTTGQIFPVREIGHLARDRGIFFALDGVQALGARPLDVTAMNVDAYATSAHKWILGPRRTGILYVRRGMWETIRPTVVGAYSDRLTDLDGMRLELQDSAQRYEFGTQNDALFYGLGEAVAFISAIGLAEIERHNAALAEAFVSGLEEIPGAEILSPARRADRSAMITFRLTGQNYRDVTSALGRERFRVRPVGEAHLDAIRISFHVYNSAAEVERLLDTLNGIAS